MPLYQRKQQQCDRTTFPDLFAEERRDILLEMRIPVLDDALEEQEILRVTLTYFNTVTSS